MINMKYPNLCKVEYVKINCMYNENINSTTEKNMENPSHGKLSIKYTL